MQLETNPAEPYSVNLAYTVLGGRFYVNAGGTETRWAAHIAADPRVRLRLDERLYDLRARRVTVGESRVSATSSAGCSSAAPMSRTSSGSSGRQTQARK